MANDLHDPWMANYPRTSMDLIDPSLIRTPCMPPDAVIIRGRNEDFDCTNYNDDLKLCERGEPVRSGNA